ncbi:MAG: superinfection immunity protein [Dehalococcoidales bacterium]|jgi:hypothetical protein|nr:superinfection immunity protein [Dehalococcoidales bacterium]MDD4793697.1 superinfection immunity protein [Dehalococcoidales bacterium]MDD5122015.1 superinfection immunity protein [Dehalococcoidales bacterium]MDD5497970.1 superinfection immunity protein [Dehalococcoidales bacterium]MDX9803283.1 superinfection immunity protein [Dehalococcoidales bacterium]
MLASYAIELIQSLPLAINPPGPIEVAIILFPLYFVPTIISLARNTDNKLTVFLLNSLLGWTFIGWVVALVLALTKSSKKDQALPVRGSTHAHIETEGYCTNCGTKTNKGMKYCPECGTRLTTSDS